MNIFRTDRITHLLLVGALSWLAGWWWFPAVTIPHFMLAWLPSACDADIVVGVPVARLPVCRWHSVSCPGIASSMFTGYKTPHINLSF